MTDVLLGAASVMLSINVLLLILDGRRSKERIESLERWRHEIDAKTAGPL